MALLIGLSSMQVQRPVKVIFFGDSITEQAAKPGGFIVKMDSMLTLKNVKDNYDLVGAGVGGNKIYDLYLRMEDDVLSKNPDVAVIFIGVNDVWHKRTSGRLLKHHTNLSGQALVEIRYMISILEWRMIF